MSISVVELTKPENGEVAAGFAQEISALAVEIRRRTSLRDFVHLLRVERIGRLCTLVGLATAWIVPNPLSAFLLAQGLTARLVIGHHVGHGAYDRIPGVPDRYTRRGFALGARRYVDWLEWWGQDEWRHLHNMLHHPNTGDDRDVDVMNPGNFKKFPLLVRYIILAVVTIAWKWFYYAPVILCHYLERREGTEELGPRKFIWGDLLDLRRPEVRHLWIDWYMPVIGLRFVLLPLLFLPLGAAASASVLANLVLAEMIHGAQGYICIRSSHSADDIPLFASRPGDLGSYFYRQVVGTVNYRPGGDWNDLLHIWTNYQIEHHLFPDATLLQLQECRQEVQDICRRYNIPYLEQNVFRRYLKTSQVFIGEARQPVRVSA